MVAAKAAWDAHSEYERESSKAHVCLDVSPPGGSFSLLCTVGSLGIHGGYILESSLAS